MKLTAILALFCLIPLTGCSTYEGLKTDIASGYNSLSDSISNMVDPVKEEKKKLPVYDGVCPPVSVRPDLVRLVDFYNPAKPSEETKVSEATFAGVHNTCRVEKGGIVMQIDLTIAGKTGPKARANPKDKPSFAYPYFVAVTDLQGNVLSKEVFAASLAYNSEQKDLTQTESIFQNMPVPENGAGQSYNVIVGFQLTEDQLAYNQRTPMPMPPAPRPIAAVAH